MTRRHEVVRLETLVSRRKAREQGVREVRGEGNQQSAIHAAAGGGTLDQPHGITTNT